MPSPRGESDPTAPQPRPADSAGPGPADIDAFLAWTLVRTGHGLEQVLTGSIGEHGLTTRQFGVLSLLNAYDDLTQTDLARAVLVRVQSVGPLVTSLMDRGLITRRGAGGRGRRAHFDLTDTGHQLLASAWQGVTECNDPSSIGLDADEATELTRLLSKVLARIGHPGTVSSETDLRAP